jgi:DnaD/phage-associated family protein
MASRTWVKIYCDNWLDGSISDEDIVTRGVWACLLALTGSGRFSDKGEIKVSENIGFNDKQVANLIKIDVKIWQKVKQILIKTDRIIVDSNDIIKVINWTKYQSEYERQKPYRNNNKLLEKVTNESYKQSDSGDKRIDKRIEIIDKEEESSSSILSSFEITQELFNLYESQIGQLVPVIEDEIREALKKFPSERITFAITEAVKKNKRSWSYIAGILNNTGKPKSQNKSSPPDDPSKYTSGMFGKYVQH